jgi:hypothetical protein
MQSGTYFYCWTILAQNQKLTLWLPHVFVLNLNKAQTAFQTRNKEIVLQILLVETDKK